MTRSLGLVLLAACWTASAPPPAEPQAPPPVVARRVASASRSPCETTVEHLLEVERDEMAGIPDFADKLEAIRDAAIASCLETGWSRELLGCFGDTTDNNALRECESLVTPAQTQDLMRRISDILSQRTAPPPISP